MFIAAVGERSSTDVRTGVDTPRPMAGAHGSLPFSVHIFGMVPAGLGHVSQCAGTGLTACRSGALHETSQSRAQRTIGLQDGCIDEEASPDGTTQGHLCSCRERAWPCCSLICGALTTADSLRACMSR